MTDHTTDSTAATSPICGRRTAPTSSTSRFACRQHPGRRRRCRRRSAGSSVANWRRSTRPRLADRRSQPHLPRPAPLRSSPARDAHRRPTRATSPLPPQLRFRTRPNASHSTTASGWRCSSSSSNSRPPSAPCSSCTTSSGFVRRRRLRSSRTPAACRQIASRARRRIESETGPARFEPDLAEQQRVAQRSSPVCAGGDSTRSSTARPRRRR